MPTNVSGEFEENITRLEAIVKSLESEETTLDQAVQLFKEGKERARRCEVLLKIAQDTINSPDELAAPAAASKLQASAREPTDELPF